MLLIDAIHRLIDERFAGLRKVGTVTAVIAPNKVDVLIDGGTMRLPRMAHYTPTVGDKVHIDTAIRGSWIVVGKPA